MHEEEPVCKCVGSFINWVKPFEEVIEKSFDPSLVLMSLDHQCEDLALKSPVITDNDGLRFLISFKSFSKFCKNKSNSLLF